MSTDLAARLDRIEARHALNDLVANYSLRVDARTYDTLADLFTADGTFAFADMKVSGRADLLQFWKTRISNYEFTYHYLHSHVITSIDLAANTGTGIVTGHAEMPVFRFPPNDVNAILTYIESISAR